MAHEPILTEALELLAARRSDENRLGRISQDKALACQGCRDACRFAIEDAGGPEVIARAIREALLVQGRWYQTDEGYSALSQAEAGLRTARQ